MRIHAYTGTSAKELEMFELKRLFTNADKALVIVAFLMVVFSFFLVKNLNKIKPFVFMLNEIKS